ncbi:hypothetical protein [Candidatus Allofournierella merdipullorum]|uniref:hypothetical protein n=1 Tax=Candidatus Allofournierella merdipullorum TaxID=2838595 RepID=UPI00374EC5B8
MFVFYQFNSVKSTGNRRFSHKNSKKVISSVLKALAKRAANHLPERVCGLFLRRRQGLAPLRRKAYNEGKICAAANRAAQGRDRSCAIPWAGW